MDFNRSCLLALSFCFLITACTKEKEKTSLAGRMVWSVYIDPAGVKWFATDKGISSFDGETWINYDDRDGLPIAGMNDLAPDPDIPGEVWIACGTGVVLARLEPGSLSVLSHYTASNSDLVNDTVYAVAPDNSGYTWMGTAKGVSGMKNDDWYIPDDEPYSRITTGIGCAPDGWNYFATNGGGVARLRSGVDGISSASSYFMPWAGLPSDNVYAVYIEPATGYQWFGTDQGAAHHSATETKRNWVSFTTEDGLVNNFVLAVAGDGDGGIWFGTMGGISRLLNGAWTSFTETDGLADNTVYAIAFDHDGSAWFGTANGVSHYQSGTWVNYP